MIRVLCMFAASSWDNDLELATRQTCRLYFKWFGCCLVYVCDSVAIFGRNWCVDFVLGMVCVSNR